jgi:LacI family transcriptional regulator
VVNREPNVRESTRERVLKAVAQLNYQPNISARNLASLRSHLIGLVYDDPSAYAVPSAGYVIRLQQGVLRACGEAGYELLIHPCNYRNPDVGAELKALIARARPDGIILAAPLSNMPEIVEAIEATNASLVRLSPGEENGEQYIVVTNDRQVCAEMTRYLASLGHERIGFITGHPNHKAVQLRFDGYKDGLQQSELAIADELVAAGDNSFGSGEACGNKLLSLENPPTAIFAANDDMAAGVLRAADKRGIDVPGQLSIAGFDDISLAQQIHPSLTTIRQPLAAMAERAATALIRRPGDDGSLRGTDVVPATLMIRESTGPAPV